MPFFKFYKIMGIKIKIKFENKDISVTYNTNFFENILIFFNTLENNLLNYKNPCL